MKELLKVPARTERNKAKLKKVQAITKDCLRQKKNVKQREKVILHFFFVHSGIFISNAIYGNCHQSFSYSPTHTEVLNMFLNFC